MVKACDVIQYHRHSFSASKAWWHVYPAKHIWKSNEVAQASCVGSPVAKHSAFLFCQASTVCNLSASVGSHDVFGNDTITLDRIQCEHLQSAESDPNKHMSVVLQHLDSNMSGG